MIRYFCCDAFNFPYDMVEEYKKLKNKKPEYNNIMDMFMDGGEDIKDPNADLINDLEIDELKHDIRTHK